MSKLNSQTKRSATRGAQPKQQKNQKQGNGGKKSIKGNGGGRTVKAPSAIATSFVSRAPKITQTPKSCRVVHRELIASITGSTAFTVANTFELNPGVSATFPWLALMAQAWEQYEFNNLRFRYVTRTGTNVPGSVMIVPDYDAADSAPADEATASSYQDAIEDADRKSVV